MSDVIVKNSHLHFLGKNYFRGGSESVELGSFGKKRSPITQTNYLEVQGRIPVSRLKIKKATEVTIDFSKTTEKDLLANIDVAGVFKGSPKTAYEDLKTGKLKLVKFEVSNLDIREAANDSPKVIEELIEYGNDARITDEIFVVMEAKMAKSFTSSTSFGVSVNVGVVKVTVDLGFGSNGNTSFELAKGTTFAYGMLKLDWDANQKKNKTKIVAVTDDQWGPN
jgi:hypothetical protein